MKRWSIMTHSLVRCGLYKMKLWQTKHTLKTIGVSEEAEEAEFFQVPRRNISQQHLRTDQVQAQTEPHFGRVVVSTFLQSASTKFLRMLLRLTSVILVCVGSMLTCVGAQGASKVALPRDYGVKLCGREFIRAVIFTCGGSRWKRSLEELGE